MSKWLKRGKGSNSNISSSSAVGPTGAALNGYSAENGSISSAQPSMTVTAATAANHYAGTPQPQGMVGYSGPAGPAVDVITSDGRSNKPYNHHSASSHQAYHGGQTTVSGAAGLSGQQRRSTSRSRRSVSHGGPDDAIEPRGRARSSSRRSSGPSSSSRQRAGHHHQPAANNGPTSSSNYHYSSQSPAQVGVNGGPTNAPHGMTSNPPQHHNYDNGPIAHPVTTQDFPTKMTTASVTPPQDPSSSQSNYPPAISASNSHLSTHRRPAYLLHRDLVIGKGSYGQVCIASRGEAEGHTSGSGSGKRKKFACKCVVLRNDPKYIAKLQEEVNVLRELRGHDNVIRLYDVFCVDNELFIITELGRGGDLFHLLTTHPKHGVTEAYAGKCPDQTAFFVFLLLASFLTSSHSNPPPLVPYCFHHHL